MKTITIWKEANRERKVTRWCVPSKEKIGNKNADSFMVTERERTQRLMRGKYKKNKNKKL